MKASFSITTFLLLLGVVLGASGCAQMGRQRALHHTRTYAIAVSLPDGTQLTPEQWAFVKNTFEQSLAAQGGVLVADITDAERILRVEFVPDALDPTSGQATVLSVRTNPLYAYAATRPAYSSLAFHGGISSHSSLFRYYDSYYGHYYDYVPAAYSPPIVTRPDPNNGGKPFDPDDCPPGMERPDRSNGRVVYNETPTARHRGYQHPGDGGSQRAERVHARTVPDASEPSTRYARRESSGSRTERTYSRGSSSSSGSGRERSYSRSSGSSSRSEPSYSSSSGSSSSSSSASSSSSSSSSSSYSAPSSSDSSYSSSAASSPSYTNDIGGGAAAGGTINYAK